MNLALKRHLVLNSKKLLVLDNNELFMKLLLLKSITQSFLRNRCCDLSGKVLCSFVPNLCRQNFITLHITFKLVVNGDNDVKIQLAVTQNRLPKPEWKLWPLKF